MNPNLFVDWWKFLMIVKTPKAQRYLKVQTIVFISIVAIALLMKIFSIHHINVGNINTRFVMLSILVLSISSYLAFILPALRVEKDENNKAAKRKMDNTHWADALHEHSWPAGKPRPKDL